MNTQTKSASGADKTFARTGWTCDSTRGLTAIDAAIQGRLGRRMSTAAMSKADERDAQIMLGMAEQRYARWCAYVGVPHEFSSDTGANR